MHVQEGINNICLQTFHLSHPQYVPAVAKCTALSNPATWEGPTAAHSSATALNSVLVKTLLLAIPPI